ncbi:MAG: trigger factor [Candidatus Ratteibacteria bacterium]|nr:trigger factor [Candidatus Ratteibacteria bacterium]
MQVQVKDLDKNKKSLSIEIPQEEVGKRLTKTYSAVLNSASIPGFRKGKAPLKILKLYYGKNINRQVAEELVSEYYKKAVAEKNLKVAMEPEIKIGRLADGDVDLNEDKPLKFEAIVEIFPKVKIGEYKGVEIEAEKTEITKEDVEAVLERKREEKAELIPVTNRPSQRGDLITIDYQIEIAGKIAKELKNQKLILGKTPLPKGWEKELTAVKKGDVKEIREESKSEKSKGKKVVYKLTVKDIQERRLLVLTDDFARKLGNFENLDKAREKIKAELEGISKIYEEENLRRAVTEKVLKNSDIEVPPSVIKRFSEYYMSLNKDLSEEESKKIAGENIKQQLIIEEIAKKEKIEVTDEEVNKRKKEIQARDGSEEDIKENLQREKVLRFLVENAKVKEKAKKMILTPEEAGKLSSSKKGSIITV